MSIHIGQILRQASLRYPDATALVEVDAGAARPSTYAELDERARRLARALHDRGVQPGESVGLMANNSAQFVAAWFAIVYAGCTVVPVPVRSAAREVGERMVHSSVALLLVDDAALATAETAAAPVDMFRVLSLDELESAAGDPLSGADPRAGESAAMVLYTSGTTGRPKGVVISHASLLCHTASLVHHTLRLTASDRVLAVLPLTHSYGCRMTMLVPFYAAATVVLPRRFDARASYQLIRDEAITWVPAVPTMFAAWARAAEGEHQVTPPASLVWCLSAGAPLPDEIRQRAELVLGAEIRQGYGMTEATFSTINSPPAPRIPGSVGSPVWGVELRVVDDDGGDCPPGGRGEVWLRGQNVMAGYFRDAEATARTLRDGWVRSGDVGVLDQGGRLAIVDRRRDLILRGGFSIYPSEVEEILHTYPGVAQVAVVGRPDAFYGEEIVAVVVPSLAELDLTALAAHGRALLGREKVPREWVLVDELPLGPSGKVQKRALREQIANGAIVPQRLEVGSAS